MYEKPYLVRICLHVSFTELSVYNRQGGLDWVFARVVKENDDLD